MSGFDLDASVAATLAMRPVRDPNAECYVFTQQPGEKQDCYGDGHYLCQECTRYQLEEDR